MPASGSAPRHYRTLVEAASFRRDIEGLLDDDEIGALYFAIARNPRAGQIVPGTGGVRNLRWARKGMGKRGGARIVYYFHSEALPVFMLAAYAKNVKVKLTKSEQAAIKKLVGELIEEYSGLGSHRN